MVKGVTRKVIVVKNPDRYLFEEAIFIVRDQAAEGVSGQQVLAEAQRAADGYLRRNTPRGRWLEKIPAPVYGAVGAAAATLVWLAVFIT